MSGARSPAVRWISVHRGAIAGVALLVLAVWEIVVLWRAHAGVPAETDWRRAAAAIQTSHQRGDLILFAPGWIDPLARVYVGDLMTVEQAARMDATRYGRIWEVSIRGARSPETRGLGRPAFDETFGEVRVRQWTRPAPAVTWDLRARAKLLEVDFTPRLCVPVSVGAAGRPPVRMDVGTARLGGRLAVYAGLSDFRTRKENRSYAKLRVLVDEQEVAAGVIGNESGWKRVGGGAVAPGEHKVVLEATTDPTRGEKKPQHLSLCVMAESYE